MTGKEKVTPHDELLSGWKDIAKYMSKGVRTVQRYERELGLPVRRLAGTPTGAVIAIKSDLDSWIRSSPTAQESFNKGTRGVADHLASEIARGLQDKVDLEARMAGLRKEVSVSVSKVRESLFRLRQQLNEMRRRQDFLASVIKSHSTDRASLFVNGKRQKPN